MRGRWAFVGMKILILLVIVFLGFGEAVLHLWNWLMPSLFGLHMITFWQAIGLIGLSWILFRGGFLGARPYGFGRGRNRWRRWQHMSPEEREKFRQGMRDHCGHFSAKPPEPVK